MKRLLLLPATAAVSLVQSLPLGFVAWLGRRLGDLAWWLDWHHRRLALVNLDIAFGPELARRPRERLARTNFRLIGESVLCTLKTAAMDTSDIRDRLLVVGLNKIRPWIERTEVPGVVIAMGHFGNLEMFDFAARELPWMEVASVYRRSRSSLINGVLERVRRNCQCRFFDEATQQRQLRTLLRQGNVILGLMGDVSGGPRGRSVPFFGHPVSTSAAPAIYARRFRMPLHAAVCYRSAPGRWRVEISDEIPTGSAERPRPVEDILHDLNRHFEHSIRRDPANWFWPHRRWEYSGRRRNRATIPPAP
jgi:KDO2-lipid IV(A) lauroyltransferase